MEIPVGFGIARILFSFAGKTGEGVSTFAYRDEGIHTQAEQAQIIDTALQTTGAPMHGANMVVGTGYDGVSVTFMTVLGPLAGDDPANVNGVITGNQLTPNVAFLIRKRTARGGRQGRGRMFTPPVWINEAGVNGDGSFDSTSADVLTGQWNIFLEAVQDEGIFPVLLHSDPALDPDDILAFQMQPLVATQRRRLR